MKNQLLLLYKEDEVHYAFYIAHVAHFAPKKQKRHTSELNLTIFQPLREGPSGRRHAVTTFETKI